MITGLAHTGVCVPDCAAAVAFYRDVLGLRVLSPPYVMAGDDLRDDMGELVGDPTMKAAIVGLPGPDALGDRVFEGKGVRFLSSGIADVARVRTAWFVDPWGVVFILVEKSRPERAYFAQWG